MMNKRQIEEKRRIESETRALFNRKNQVNAEKRKLKVGQATKPHEFDLFDPSKVIGGITTSPWIVGKHTNNTGGQDRISAELLWLTLWSGNERRVMILTDKEMASKMHRRWGGCPFPHRIEIIHCDLSRKRFETIGLL